MGIPKPSTQPTGIIDAAQLTHEDVDLTITALEIYATALRDEIDEQNPAIPGEEEEFLHKAGFNYERRLEEVQEVLKKYREILKGLLTA